MNFLFAWRYFRAKKSTNAINIIAWVSMAAIVVGATSLILVLSVFNGFEDLVKSLYTSFYPDVKITPATGKTLTLTQQQLQQLAGVKGVRALSLEAQDNAVLQNGDWRTIAYLKGVDENYTKVTGIKDKVVRGKFELGTEDHPLAVLGSGIENALSTESDRAILPLSVFMFKKGEGNYTADPASSLSNANMATSGAFFIQQDFDNHYVITNLAFVKQMLGLKPDEYSGAEIALNDPLQGKEIKPFISRLLGKDYVVQTRYEQNQSLYNVMGMEKWVIYIMLTLILVVAAFNMVGALTMLVWEKQKDIHVLKALGADNGRVQRIFLSEGILLAGLGGGCGILLAVLICWLQVRYHLVPLQGGSFLIDYYPVKLVPTDFLLVLSTIFVVALLASWIPARKAAATPIELR
ncbi:MAG: ABC transporter permease [Chitinophagaceae bacterium]|nr:ABC transporter permease [Chitinophagaceae bacterium]